MNLQKDFFRKVLPSLLYVIEQSGPTVKWVHPIKCYWMNPVITNTKNLKINKQTYTNQKQHLVSVPGNQVHGNLCPVIFLQFFVFVYFGVIFVYFTPYCFHFFTFNKHCYNFKEMLQTVTTQTSNSPGITLPLR